MTHTHADLCKIAVDWLQRPHSRKGPGCSVALSETANAISGEIPDAIGWRPFKQDRCAATVVEVKVTRADFLADYNKQHRKNSGVGMGAYRYYMAPVGLILPQELPERWGLLEVTDRGHVKVRLGHVLHAHVPHRPEHQAWRHDNYNQLAELSLLALALARVGDPQKLQDMLREAGRRESRLASECERLRGEVIKLQTEVIDYRTGGVIPQAIPRRRG